MDVEGDQKQPLSSGQNAAGGRIHFRQMPPRLDPSEPYQGIGTDLQAARRQRGLSVTQVAQQLRIQASHIEALETGNVHALPGATYAIGFLRSYADFVGFDAEAAVARFKEEEAIRADPTRLVFPEPLEAARRPGWRLALTSLAVLVAAYGVWVYIERQGLPEFETVSSPPERMTAMVSTPPPGSPATLPAGQPVAPAADDNGSAAPVASVAPRPTEATAAPPADAEETSATGPVTAGESETTVAAGDDDASAAGDDGPDAQNTADSGRAVVPQVTHVEPTRVEVPSSEPASEPAPALATASREGEQAAEADASALAGGNGGNGGSGDSQAEPATTSATPETTVAAAPAAAAALPARTPADDTPAPAVREDAAEPRAPVETAAPADTPAVREPAPALPDDDAPAAANGNAILVLPAPPPLVPQTAARPTPPAAAPPPSSIVARRDTGPPPPPAPVQSASNGGAASSSGPQGYRPQAFGAVNEGARVVIRARNDSWVQVQGPNNELLLTRILRAGDVYHAPDRGDLVLMTGNAGAIEVIVDGQSLGPLGPEGEVRRGIALQADGLRTQLRRGRP